jgi:hypothetical protein
MRFHFLNPDDLSLSKAAFAQGPILGDSGPLQWSKKAKTECPNPNSHSYLTASVYQKLGLVASTTVRTPKLPKSKQQRPEWQAALAFEQHSSAEALKRISLSCSRSNSATAMHKAQQQVRCAALARPWPGVCGMVVDRNERGRQLRRPLTLSGLARPGLTHLQAIPSLDRSSWERGDHHNQNTGTCASPCRREAVLGSRRPRNGGKSVVWLGP